MTKSNTSTLFNAEVHVKELNERFSRLIKNFGANNKKGTDRYNYEVQFAYALNEISQAPTYMKGKMFDRASNIVSKLIAQLKTQGDTPAEVK
jgi:hypothetical protein